MDRAHREPEAWIAPRRLGPRVASVGAVLRDALRCGSGLRRSARSCSDEAGLDSLDRRRCPQTQALLHDLRARSSPPALGLAGSPDRGGGAAVWLRTSARVSSAQREHSQRVALELPLGRAPGRKESEFVTAFGQPIPDPNDAILAVPTRPLSLLRSLATPRSTRLPLAQPSDPLVGLAETPRAQALLAGCPLLLALARKAWRAGHLAGTERRTLVESLAALRPGERELALRRLLAPLPGAQREAWRALKRSPSPSSCRVLRARHLDWLSDLACPCPPGLAKGLALAPTELVDTPPRNG